MPEASAKHLSDNVRPFQIKLDGEVIAEIPDYRAVERVHVMTSSGEAAAPAIAFDQDSIDLFVDLRSHLDAEMRDSTRDLAAQEIAGYEPPPEVLVTNRVALALEEERTAGEQSDSDGASDSGSTRRSDSASDRTTDKVDKDKDKEKASSR